MFLKKAAITNQEKNKEIKKQLNKFTNKINRKILNIPFYDILFISKYRFHLE